MIFEIVLNGWNSINLIIRYIQAKRTVCIVQFFHETNSTAQLNTRTTSAHNRLPTERLNFARVEQFNAKLFPFEMATEIFLFARQYLRTKHTNMDWCEVGWCSSRSTLSFMGFSSTENETKRTTEWWNSWIVARMDGCSWVTVCTFRNRIIIMALMCLNLLLFNCSCAHRKTDTVEQMELEVNVKRNLVYDVNDEN